MPRYLARTPAEDVPSPPTTFDAALARYTHAPSDRDVHEAFLVEIARLRRALADIRDANFGVSGMSAGDVEAEFRTMAREALLDLLDGHVHSVRRAYAAVIARAEAAQDAGWK